MHWSPDSSLHNVSSQTPIHRSSNSSSHPSLNFGPNLARRLVHTHSGSSNGLRPSSNDKAKVDVKGKKHNVWSIDNEAAKEGGTKHDLERRGGRDKRKKSVKRRGKNSENVMVSSSMLVEVETVLQTQEPVIRPVWNTFTSNVSGIWKGVGAAFSPSSAQMEPIAIGSKNDPIYDCYTFCSIDTSSGQINRKINWLTPVPRGKSPQSDSGNLPPLIDFENSEVMEEDTMGYEAGLVFFEDGSYSRGPTEISVGDMEDSQYYLSPTFKFEQCLVKGCHKRLRVVHTIQFCDGGSDIQILRVAAYEEQWVSPVNLPELSETEVELKPFSQRGRTQPLDLTGSWKVFEMSATPIFETEMVSDGSNGIPYVYLCTEILKKRRLPENAICFGEEEMSDMQDATMLWLPGGVTCYVDVNKAGTLCVGVGWYSSEGINLAIERDYGVDGKLEEVRHKSEVKRRWPDSHDL